MTCPICLMSTNLDYTTPCGHSFHKICVKEWFLTNDSKTCPVCRAMIPDTCLEKCCKVPNQWCLPSIWLFINIWIMIHFQFQSLILFFYFIIIPNVSILLIIKTILRCRRVSEARVDQIV